MICDLLDVAGRGVAVASVGDVACRVDCGVLGADAQQAGGIGIVAEGCGRTYRGPTPLCTIKSDRSLPYEIQIDKRRSFII